MKNLDDRLQLPDDPMDGFLHWFEAAVKANIPDPTIMTLATSSPAGRPSARIVLFKEISVSKSGERGLSFYTNYRSRKSVEMEENPYAAAVFHWMPLGRQIRFEGRVEKVSVQESEAYFQTRPRGSQIGAWSSPQSQKIVDRDQLKEKVQEIERRFDGQDVLPCPPFWGGWRLLPTWVEFWEQREHRLHERRAYEKAGLAWISSSLAP